jgi:hypothetical protein
MGGLGPISCYTAMSPSGFGIGVAAKRVKAEEARQYSSAKPTRMALPTAPLPNGRRCRLKVKYCRCWDDSGSVRDLPGKSRVDALVAEAFHDVAGTRIPVSNGRAPLTPAPGDRTAAAARRLPEPLVQRVACAHCPSSLGRDQPRPLPGLRPVVRLVPCRCGSESATTW